VARLVCSSSSAPSLNAQTALLTFLVDLLYGLTPRIFPIPIYRFTDISQHIRFFYFFFFSGRLQMHDLKMQDWKMTDNILANSWQNYGVWKMQDWKMTDHVN